jgi:hypothetical protein
MPGPLESTLSITVVDNSRELARFSFVPDPSFAAGVLTPPYASGSPQEAFFNALALIQDGTIIRVSYNRTLRVSNAAFAPSGHREDRWLIIYQDNVTLKLYTTEIPCRKVSLNVSNGSDERDLSVAPWSTFKSAFETVARSPEGNPITVLSIRLIGRNL